jgi:cytochrome b6-f complex iron-sulfur subunit
LAEDHALNNIAGEAPDSPVSEEELTRRKFLIGTGAAACSIVAAGSGMLAADYLRPRALFEPPTRFSLVPPDAMEVGQVITSEANRAYVMRLSDGFRALSSVCTHLGCITRFESDSNQIACPCHGSRFNLDGEVLAGPAPRPLDWLSMELSSRGDIMVDTAEHVPLGTTFKL